MKNTFSIAGLLITIFMFNAFPLEQIDLASVKRVDFSTALVRNGIYLRYCIAIDVDNQGNYYFLDAQQCRIFKVKQKEGELVKAISSRGQGPGELITPRSLRVRNGLIFVADKGYGGIKIFDIDGKFVREFKTSSTPGDIDVDKINTIYVGETNKTERSLISKYNETGDKIGSVINYGQQIIDAKNNPEFIRSTYFHFVIDRKENLVLVFPLKRELAKYNKDGKSVWNTNISNRLIDKFPTEEDRIELGKETVTMTYHVFHVDVSSSNKILVGHAGGGAVYDESGQLISLITGNNTSLRIFRIYDDNVISAAVKSIDIYEKLFK